jgi:uncharacterized protein
VKLHLDSSSSRTSVSSYGEGFVVVNQERFTSSLVAYPESVRAEWGPRSVEELDGASLDVLFQEGSPEIVIIGTGRRQRFPPTELLAPLYARRIGIEIMDTFAACRTFNVLAGEDRVVVAGLIIE